LRRSLTCCCWRCCHRAPTCSIQDAMLTALAHHVVQDVARLTACIVKARLIVGHECVGNGLQRLYEQPQVPDRRGSALMQVTDDGNDGFGRKDVLVAALLFVLLMLPLCIVLVML